MPKLALTLLALLLSTSCERKPPNCRAIHDMNECKATAGCTVSSVWVMGFPDAKPLPEHHQYECIAKP
jgi:hypothetical protein